MNQVNYQKELEKILNTLQEKGEATSDWRPPRLFLHSCCAPCSSYCLEYLCRYFLITVFYYNPNIYPPEEYHMRAQEQKRFIDEFPVKNPVHFVEGVYDTKRFYDMARGMELCLRAVRGALSATGCVLRRVHSMQGSIALIFYYDTFHQPLKNAEKLNEIGKDFREPIWSAISFL